MSNSEKILTYISSSELNRCKKNGLNLREPRELWINVLKEPWLTRKLRRKIGHLFQLDLLPTIPKKVIGLFNPSDYADEADYSLYKDLGKMIQKQFLDAEDHYILTGEIKSQI